MVRPFLLFILSNAIISISHDIIHSSCRYSQFTLRKVTSNSIFITTSCGNDVLFNIEQSNTITQSFNSFSSNPTHPLILPFSDTSYYLIFSTKAYTCKTTSSSYSGGNFPGKTMSESNNAFQISNKKFIAIYTTSSYLKINYYHMLITNGMPSVYDFSINISNLYYSSAIILPDSTIVIFYETYYNYSYRAIYYFFGNIGGNKFVKISSDFSLITNLNYNNNNNNIFIPLYFSNNIIVLCSFSDAYYIECASLLYNEISLRLSTPTSLKPIVTGNNIYTKTFSFTKFYEENRGILYYRINYNLYRMNIITTDLSVVQTYDIKVNDPNIFHLVVLEQFRFFFAYTAQSSNYVFYGTSFTFPFCISLSPIKIIGNSPVTINEIEYIKKYHLKNYMLFPNEPYNTFCNNVPCEIDTNYRLTQNIQYIATQSEIISVKYNILSATDMITTSIKSSECSFTFFSCHIACKDCDDIGTDTNQKCISCDTTRGYYPYYQNTSHCKNINDKEDNEYLNYNVPLGNDPMIELCHSNCSSCSIGGNATNTNCITCNEVNNFYPLEDDSSQCYHMNDIISNYAFDTDNNIFKKCVSGCDECLYPFDESNHHCTQCNSEYEEYYFPLIDQYNCYPKRLSESVLKYKYHKLRIFRL